MPDIEQDKTQKKSGSTENGTDPGPGSTVRMTPDGTEIIPPDGFPAMPADTAEKPDLDTTAASLLTRKPLKKYRFVRSIGRGGMKMVLQVRDLDTTRDVAMAVLRDAAARPKEDLARFVEEARLTARLEHPNIVPVHEIGLDLSGAPYFTMKLLHGRTLATLIEKLAAGDPVCLREYQQLRMLRIFIKICHGVAFAHSRGVIHLDLKPENIQIGDFGEVLILDWGLAKAIENQEEKTTTGSAPPARASVSGIPAVHGKILDAGKATEDGVMKGTPGYMAPEQAAGKNSCKDRRTDIYSLGAILYAMMTFQDPVGKRDVREKIGATLSGNIIPPRERSPEREIPAAVEAIIQKAMSLDPADRYQSVHELRDEVNAFIGGYATVAEKASFAKKILLFLKRHILLTAVLVPTLFLLVAGITHMIQEKSRFLAKWRTAVTLDLSSGKAAGYHIGAPLNRERRHPRLMKNGSLILKAGEWLWLDRSVLENFKLELIWNAAADEIPALDICVRARDLPLNSASEMVPGYTFRLGNMNGTRDFLFRCAPAPESRPQALASAPTLLTPGRNTITIRRKEETLTLSSPGQPGGTLSVTDFFEQAPGCAIGIRILGSPVEILSVKLLQESVPERPSPLLKGDIFSEAGLYDCAFTQYLDAAEIYKNSTFSDKALVRAAQIAAFKLSGSAWKDEARLREVKERIRRRPGFFQKAQIRDIDAQLLWLQGRYAEAFDKIESILSGDPESNIIHQILNLPRQTALPPDVAEKLLRLLARKKKTAVLDLSGLGIHSLKPLAKLPLVWLNCSFNNLSSLDGIDAMPLQFLDCRDNPDLSIPAALRGQPDVFRLPKRRKRRFIKIPAALRGQPDVFLFDGEKSK